MKKEELLNMLKRYLSKIDPGIDIILFGSRARGDYKKDSDWDILVLTSEGLSKHQYEQIKDAIFRIEIELEEPISTLMYSKNEWEDLEITPLYQVILAEGEKI